MAANQTVHPWFLLMNAGELLLFLVLVLNRQHSYAHKYIGVVEL